MADETGRATPLDDISVTATRSAFGIRGIKVIVDGIPETLPDGQANVDSIDIGSTGYCASLRLALRDAPCS
jgi:hypothetical protein